MEHPNYRRDSCIQQRRLDERGRNDDDAEDLGEDMRPGADEEMQDIHNIASSVPGPPVARPEWTGPHLRGRDREHYYWKQTGDGWTLCNRKRWRYHMREATPGNAGLYRVALPEVADLDT